MPYRNLSFSLLVLPFVYDLPWNARINVWIKIKHNCCCPYHYKANKMKKIVVLRSEEEGRREGNWNVVVDETEITVHFFLSFIFLMQLYFKIFVKSVIGYWDVFNSNVWNHMCVLNNGKPVIWLWCYATKVLKTNWNTENKLSFKWSNIYEWFHSSISHNATLNQFEGIHRMAWTRSCCIAQQRCLTLEIYNYFTKWIQKHTHTHKWISQNDAIFSHISQTKPKSIFIRFADIIRSLAHTHSNQLSSLTQHNTLPYISNKYIKMWTIRF